MDLEENEEICGECQGLGRLEGWWGCGDPDCCGTDMCYPCDGTGRIIKENDE